MSDLVQRLEAAIANDDPALADKPTAQPKPDSAPPQPAQKVAVHDPDALDFSDEQRQTPVDAAPPPQTAPPAPAPQVAQTPAAAPQSAMPPPAQQPQPPAITPLRNMSAANIAGAYEYDTNAALQDEAQANRLKKDALINTAGLQQNINDERQKANEATLGSDAHFQKVRDVIDAKHMEETNAAMAEFDRNVQEERQLAHQDPHDFWGNSSTVNKISAVIGMIGAGLAHKDASQWFQNIINNRVAETQRKQSIFQQLGKDIRYKKYATDDKYRTELSSVEAKRVAATDSIKQQLKVNLGKYANPQVRANLEDAAADLDMQAAKSRREAINHVTTTRMGLHAVALAEQRLALEREQQSFAEGKQGTGAAAYNRDYAPIAGISNEGVQRNSSKEFTKDQALTANTVDGLDEAIKIFHSANSLPEKERLLAVNAAFSSGDIRNKLGVGANITGDEGAYMKAFLPKIDSFLVSGAGYGEIEKTLKEAKNKLLSGHLNKFNSVRSANSEITPSYPLYKQIQAMGQEEQIAQGEAKEVEAIEAQNRGNPQKAILQLEAAGADPQHPNALAKQKAAQLLEQMRANKGSQSGGFIFGL